MRVLKQFLVLGAVVLSALGSWAGNLDSPGAPTAPASAMYRIEDVYNRLDTGAAGATQVFTDPASGPTAGTMHTLNEVMAKAPLLDAANGATAAQVLSGKTFWGLLSGGWGTLTGTMPIQTLSAANDTVAAGYYAATTLSAVDGDLATANVRAGQTIFGVSGDANVVNTSSGDAVAAEISSGKKAWVDGAEVTGSATAGANVTGSAGALVMTIPDGLYSGSKTATANDADLVAGNIQNGVDIFGVTGTVYPAPVAKTGATDVGNPLPANYTEVAGEDGHASMRKGVAWPGTRFSTDTPVSGTVRDNLTGLIWLTKANYIQSDYPGFDADVTSGDGRVTWQHALDFVAGMNAGTYANQGYTDWRLPNVQELQSVIDYGKSNPALPAGHTFLNVNVSSFYWSSTTDAGYTSYAWVVGLGDGFVGGDGKGNPYYVWPVRGGQ